MSETSYESAGYEHGMARAKGGHLTKGEPMKTSYRFLMSTLMGVCLATAGSGSQAELLRTESAANTERERLSLALQRPEIRARLVAQGVDPAAADARIAALTDDEATELASRFDELPAGGRGDGLVAAVAVALMVFVVIKFLPFILIGGGALAAIKASERSGV